MAVIDSIGAANQSLSFKQVNDLFETIHANIQKEYFLTFDFDHDNMLSQGELEDLNYRTSTNRRGGVSQQFWYELKYVNVAPFQQFQGLDDQFLAHDHNADGFIDYKESYNDKLTTQRLAYISIDVDASDAVTSEELFNERHSKFEILDVDNDSVLSFREFSALKVSQSARRRQKATRSGRGGGKQRR